MVQNSAPKRVKLPRLAANPASGRMTSLGSGGKKFSSAIAIPAPTPPSRSMRDSAQPAMPSVGAAASAGMAARSATVT